MTAPLLTTKLLPPTLLPSTLARQRLLDQLDQGRHSKLLLICAPAGYGKTTLLRQWMNQWQVAGGKWQVVSTSVSGLWSPVSRSPISQSLNLHSPLTTQTAWLTLDPADNDPRCFVTYLLATLRPVVPSLEVAMEPLLAGPQMPPLEMLFTLLINEIGSIDSALVLALDDYHVIENEVIHAGLGFLIDNAPPNLHIAITSRNQPALPLARWRVRRQLTELTAIDLRFSVDEVATFMQQALDQTLAAEIVRAIDARVEGWVAGLQLAVLSLRGVSLDSPSELAHFLTDFVGDHRYVFDYLADEVLGHQPAEVRQFLLQTASFERLCAELCDAITGRSDSAQRLAQLEQSGLFLTRIGERSEWFRYHMLFAEFLRSQPLPNRSEIEQRAAQWFASQALWAEAIHHALASRDLLFAGRMIADASGYALANGLIGELAGWLARLPDAQVRADFALAVAKAWTSYLMGEIPQAADYLAVAFQQQPNDLTSDGLTSEGWVVATALRGFLAAAQQDFSGAYEYCLEALEGVGERDPMLRAIILLNLAQVQWWLGDRAALKTAGEALELSERTGNHYGAVNALSTRAQILLLLGHLNEANQLCERFIRKYTLSNGQIAPLAAIPLVNRGLVRLEQGTYGDAEADLRLGLEMSQQSGSYAPVFAGNLALVFAIHAQGRSSEALAILQELRTAAQQFGAGPMVEGAEVEIRLADGDLPFAERWRERSGLRMDAELHHTQAESYLLLAQCLIRQERTTNALTLMQRIEQFARREDRLGILIRSLILQSLAQQVNAQQNAALSTLQSALALAAPESYRRPFLTHLPDLQPLLTQLHSIHPIFIDSLLPPNLQSPVSNLPSPVSGLQSPISVPPLAEPISQRELDVLRLLVTGLSNPEIADTLIVGVGTVKTHVHNILGKLGVRNRVEVIEAAKRHGLV